MTIRQLITDGKQKLEQNKVENPSGDSWYLWEYLTGMSRVDYVLDGEKEVEEEQEKLYNELIQKRSCHVPLQHLTKVQNFMGYDFFVNEHVLIPRQDTETLVETVLEYQGTGEKILDLCTGSGCIGISLALLGNYKEVVAVDLSKEALQVAMKNKEQLLQEKEQNFSLIESDLFTNIGDTMKHSFDFIVSNPPYIPTSVCENLMEEVRDYEPRMALDGMEDGLYFYRKIIDEAREYLKDGGRLFFEIGHDQKEDMKAIFAKYQEYSQVEVKKDLAGNDRIAIAMYTRK